MSRIIRSPEAQSDIDAIALHIAQDSLNAALRWIDSIDEKLKSLARYPGAGRRETSWPRGFARFRSANTSSYTVRQRTGSRSFG